MKIEIEDERILRREFDSEEGSFMLKMRCELEWDRIAFAQLLKALLNVATVSKDEDELPRWLYQGVWFCHWQIPSWTSHEQFPRPEEEYYGHCIELLENLAYYFFLGYSPLIGDALEEKVEAL